MQKLFNKILVPVDFSPQSIMIVEKSIDIAKKHHCSIHLLHTVTIEPLTAMALAGPYPVIPFDFIDNRNELDFQLKKMCDRIAEATDNIAQASYSIAQGSWTETIIDFIDQSGADLILIGKKEKIFAKKGMVLNPNAIAGKTNVPVITIPSNRNMTRLLTILIPVTDFLPVRKLMYGIYLSACHHATIKLLAIENDRTKETTRYYLQRAYRLIHDNCSIKAELALVNNNNIAGAVNDYIKAKPADLIIVNPGAQTKMPGFFPGLFGNILQKYSLPPVLTVSPL